MPTRIRAAGKYLRCGTEKWFCQGVSYGPFKPNARGEPFPDDARLAADLDSICAMGFNTLRLYDLPSDELLHGAAARGLHLIAGIPWTDHVDFLRDRDARKAIEARVREAALRFGDHPAVAALLVGNEIEKTLVRWMGPPRVKRFIERLVGIVHAVAPDCLASYATYPSTEYLLPANADFIAVNVYLEDRDAFSRYLGRLQNLAGDRPLLITEFGADALHHGEQGQAAMRAWEQERITKQAVAGNIWFAFTDEWFRGGVEVSGWEFGLVTRERRPRPAASLVFTQTTPMPDLFMSVVVCTFNGSATLAPCLEALSRQSRTDYEVIVIDDGSTDTVPDIVRSFPQVRYQRQEHGGLSVARSLGASLARGDIIAYTDDDCMPDEDWLQRLAAAFDDPQWTAAGGPNIPPPARTAVESLVAAAPGGPSHVLLNDEEAEHLPGCNLAIRKTALEGIGGFHPDFTTAGDDVDICWRLRDAGGRLRFVPGAMVWHHRRLTVAAYLRQQRGYGRAEALLVKHHPQRFGLLGGARWHGLIYGETTRSLPPAEGAVFHGPFGLGLFQVIYTSANAFCWFDTLAGLPWIAICLLGMAPGCGALSLLVSSAALYYAWRRMGGVRPTKSSETALLWFLCLAQPVVREWARLTGLLRLRAHPRLEPFKPVILPPAKPRRRSRKARELTFWSEHGAGREEWMKELREVLAEHHIPFQEDDGWHWHDFELPGGVALLSVTEYHGGTRRLTRVAVCRQVTRFTGPCALAVALILATALSPWAGAAAGAVALGFWGRWCFAQARAGRLARLAARRAQLVTTPAP